MTAHRFTSAYLCNIIDFIIVFNFSALSANSPTIKIENTSYDWQFDMHDVHLKKMPRNSKVATVTTIIYESLNNIKHVTLTQRER